MDAIIEVTQKKTFAPKLRFKEFKDAWVRNILGDVAEIKRGAASHQLNYVNNSIEGIRLLRINDFLSNDPVYIEETEQIRKLKVKENDLLIAGTGATAGIIFIVPKEFENFSFSYNAPRIRVSSAHYYFVFSYIKSEIILKQQKKLFVGNAQPFLDTDVIRGFKINLPSIEEQQKIATFLSAVDKKIQQLTRKKELLELYKKGVMQQLFSGKLRFKDEKGRKYPDKKEIRLVDVLNLIHGDGDWILSENINKDEKYSIVQLGNIGFGYFVDKPMKSLSEKDFKLINGTLIKKGDLLINRMVDGNINACVFKFEGDYVTSVDVCWIRKGDGINNDYLLYLLLTKEYQNKLLSLSSGSGRVRISKKNLFERLYILLPNIKEQEEVANYLIAIDKKIETIIQYKLKVQSFKKGLLQQMFV